MSSLSERFALAYSEAKKQQKHLSKSQLAGYCGVRPSTVTDWFNGKTQAISGPYGLKAAEFLNVSSTWLISGLGEPFIGSSDKLTLTKSNLGNHKNLIGIQVYEIKVTNSNAKPDIAFVSCKDSLITWFSQEWFETQQLNPAQCRRFLVKDRSMEPMIWEGDTLMVDCSNNPIISGKIYAFVVNGQMHINYLYPMLDGSLLVKSLNSAIPDEIIKDKDSFRIIGRVRFREGCRLL